MAHLRELGRREGRGERAEAVCGVQHREPCGHSVFEVRDKTVRRGELCAESMVCPLESAYDRSGKHRCSYLEGYAEAVHKMSEDKDREGRCWCLEYISNDLRCCT